MTNIEDNKAPETESNENMPSQRAWYELKHEEDGVFLELLYKAQPGSKLTPELVLFDLKRRNLQPGNPGQLIYRMRMGEKRIRICDFKEPQSLDAAVFVTVSRDELSAYMQLLPPIKDGGLEIQAVLKAVEQDWSIKTGLLEDEIIKAVDEGRYFEQVLIAKGRPPEKGKDGELVFHFRTKFDYAPNLRKDGSADFRELDVFEDTTEGNVLVESIPPKEGIEGITVRGNALPAAKGRDYPLPRGVNTTVDESGRMLLAAKSGRVDYINNRVVVSDVYKINGDMDMSVGNIKFNGNVVVFGNVISGLTLDAAGDVEILGMVEAATIIAGGNIVIKGGIQGMDRGSLHAGGNIVSRFIERAEVRSGKSVFADYITYSTVTAQDSVILKGKFARIIGGLTRAGNQIYAKTIGTPSGDATVLEIGSAPESRQALIEHENIRSELNRKLERIASYLRMPAGQFETPERKEQRRRYKNLQEQLLSELQPLNEKIDMLKAELEKSSDGKIHASEQIHQDVKMTIDFATTTTKDSIPFVTFKQRSGAVVFTSFEAD